MKKTQGGRPGRIALAALAAGTMIVLSAGPVSAEPEPDPLKDLTEQVDKVVKQLLEPAAPGGTAGQEKAAAPVEQDDDSPGYETPDPVAPDHASSEGLSAGIADNDVASVGTTDSEIRDDHSSSADASALALGGTEVLGAHSDSGGTEEQSVGDPLSPVCESSNGALCATLLYAEAESHEGETTSDASARSGVAFACVGGTDTTGETCSGPVGVGVLQSYSEIFRDGSGHTEASSGSSVADVCVAPVPLTGTCTVGAAAVSSEGQSDSRGTASKESNVIGLELGGPLGDFTEPTAIALPPGCTSPSIACVFLNQGETYLGNGLAGHAVQALNVSALDGTILANAAQSETLVHKAGPRTTDLPDGPGGPIDGDAGNGDEGDGGDGGSNDGGNAGGLDDGADALPDTGGFWSGFLAIGLLTLAIGGFLVAWSRRRDLADATA